MVRAWFKLWVAFSLLACVGKAQTPYTQQIQYPYQIPTKTIYDLAIDKRGLLYLGTNKGLFRFNGKQASLVPSPEARQSDITYLKFDKWGRLWGMNFARQLFYMERDTLRPFPLQAQDIKGAIISFDFTENQIWIATNSEVASYDFKTLKKSFHYEAIGKDFTQMMSFENRIWVANQYQFYIFEEGKQASVQNTPTGSHVSFVAHKGSFYAIQRFEVNADLKRVAIQMKNGKQTRLPDIDLPTSVFVYHQTATPDQLWLCTRQGGYAFEPSTGKTHLVFPDKNLTDIVQDYQGNFWLSTLNEGLWFCPSVQNVVYALPPDLSLKMELSSVYCFEKNLYFSTNDGHILRTTFPKGTWQTLCKVAQSEVRRIVFDAEGRQFVAGLGLFDLQGNQKIETGLAKDACFYTHEGKRVLLLSHPYGFHLHLLDTLHAPPTFQGFAKNEKGSKIRNTPIYTAQPIQRSYSITVSKEQGCFWVGYDNELICFDFAGKTTPIRTKQDKPIIAHSLAVDRQGRLWAGSFQQGLFVFEGKKQVAHLQAGKELKHNHIYKLIAGKDKIWLGTEAEVGYVDIQSLQFTDVLARSGLSSSFAYTDFYPEETGIWVAMPQSVMFIPHIASKKQEELRLLPLLMLDAQTFQVEALHYKNPSKVEIKYRLKGIDNAWQTIAEPQAIIRYNHLRKGDYVLEVYAQDAITQLKSPLQTIQFHIPSAWWETWWAFLAGLVLIISAIASLAYFIIERNRKRLLFKEQLWISQIKALQSQMNPHFLYNIMNTVQGLVYSNRRGAASELLGNFSDLMRNALQISEKPYISLSEEIDLLKLYIKLEKMRFEDEIHCQIHTDFSIDAWEQPIPSMLLQPFVENAFKHGLLHKKGEKRLDIFFSRQENALQVTIEDNGIGRKHAQEIQQRQARKSTGFALGATKQRMDLLNKISRKRISLEIFDLYNTEQESTGTKIVIQIQF